MPVRAVITNLTTITDGFFEAQEECRFPGPVLYVPRHTAREHNIEERTALVLTEDESELFSRCLDLLWNDREYEHLNVRQIKEALTEIVWDVYIQRDELRDRRDRFRAIHTAIEAVARPLDMFRFMFAIDNLEPTESALTIGDVTFQVLTEEMVTYWSTRNPDRGEPELPARTGNVVAVVEERGASAGKAAARAGAAVDRALDELRVAVTEFGYRIWDNELRFRRGDSYVGTALPDESTLFGGWSNQHDYPLKIRGPLFQSVTDQLDSLAYVRSSEVSERMREQLLRAIGWIGQSMVRTDPDDKVVDLCTALECLLTTRGDGKKGEAITVRTMVLGEILEDGFRNPWDTMRLYDLRSRVVHGSARHVCSDNDYISLRSLVTEVLHQVIELLKLDRTITKPSKLMVVLADPNVLDKCVRWLAAQQDEVCGQLKDYAVSLANQ